MPTWSLLEYKHSVACSSCQDESAEHQPPPPALLLMDWRVASLAWLALARQLHGMYSSLHSLCVCELFLGFAGQNETVESSFPAGSLSHTPSSLPTRPPAAEPPLVGLLTVVCVSVLSVLCVTVLVTVVIVLVVRVRRGLRRLRGTTPTGQKTRGGGRAVENGATAHLLSVALANHNFEWCRPRSLTPTSTILPTSTPPSLTTREYSEITPLSPISTEEPLRSHLYEEVDSDDLVMTGATEGGGDNTPQVHLYSLLEDPAHHTDHTHNTSPSPPIKLQSLTSSGGSHVQDSPQSDPVSQRDTSPSSSRGSSTSLQDTSPKWVLSPVVRCQGQPRRAPRRVVPYRVSLILPLWEDGIRTSPAYPAGVPPLSSISCRELNDSGRYNRLEGVAYRVVGVANGLGGVAGYGSLEGNGVYATLEPFLGAEPMRPRSRSCDARLYNHLRH